MRIHRPCLFVFATIAIGLGLTALRATAQETADERAVMAEYDAAADLENRGKYDDALKRYEKGFDLCKQRLAPNHDLAAIGLYKQGLMHLNLGQAKKAAPLMAQGIDLIETFVGPTNPVMAEFCGHLAEAYGKIKDYKNGDTAVRRGLRAAEANAAKDPKGLVALLIQSMRFAALQGRVAEAVALADRGYRLIYPRAFSELVRLPEGILLQDYEGPVRARGTFMDVMALAKSLPNDPKVAAASATWAINGRNLHHRAFGFRSRVARASTDPTVIQLVQNLRAVRQSLTAAVMTYPTEELGTGADSPRRKELTRLVDDEFKYCRQLGGSLDVGFAEAEASRWIDLEEIRRALPTDSALIELANVPGADLSKALAGGIDVESVCYLAWIIPPAGRGEVQLVRLASLDAARAALEPLKQAIHDAQGSPAKPSSINTLGEVAAEKAFGQRLAAVAKLFLDPLLPHIRNANHWIISPDADLCDVPWAALPLPDGRYSVESHTISYVISGRDLRHRSPAGLKPSAPAIFADPEYGTAPVVKRKTDARTRAFALPAVPQLTFSADEADAISAKLRVLTGTAPILNLGNRAKESAFKELRGPHTLLMSTHGYYFKAPVPSPGLLLGKKADDRWYQASFNNLLLNSGLLLAGANDPDQTRAATGDDGILTALEIASTDLRGTELVVLSACETALGNRQFMGEGIAGLQQAFQWAGAQSVVSTLWQVPDRETSLLMIQFFDGLVAGKDKAVALRDAQLAAIKARRERNAAAHPFFWAAFTLTGN